MRLILHIDMDAFYASIEQRDCEAYRGKPLIVGGLNGRGVVATASYEARCYGIRSAMSMAEAKRRCPDGIFLPCRFERYHQVSRQLHEILEHYSPLIEPLALDEAFLDMTGTEGLFGSPQELMQGLQQRIVQELSLTASVGLAANKLLAKIASDWNKPCGCLYIPPEAGRSFLAPLPIERLWGIGPATAQKLRQQGLETVGQLAQASIPALTRKFGALGRQWVLLAQGQDERPLEPHRGIQSMGREITFPNDITEWESLLGYLAGMAEELGHELRSYGLRARAINLKLRYPTFQTVQRSHTFSKAENWDRTFFEAAKGLLAKLPYANGVRLLGLTLSRFTEVKGVSLFSEQDLWTEAEQKQQQLARAVDQLKNKYGASVVQSGRSLEI